MAAREVLTLNESTPQIRAPITGDTYSMPRALAIAAETATTDVNALSGTQTWNNAAIAFTGYKFSITDQAANAGSAAASLHSNWLAGTAGATSIMSLRKDGLLTLAVGVNAATNVDSYIAGTLQLRTSTAAFYSLQVHTLGVVSAGWNGLYLNFTITAANAALPAVPQT